jgi:hypothetical protein
MDEIGAKAVAGKDIRSSRSNVLNGAQRWNGWNDWNF